MTYSWQHKNWPEFTYSVDRLQEIAVAFAQELGLVSGLVLGLNDNPPPGNLAKKLWEL